MCLCLWLLTLATSNVVIYGSQLFERNVTLAIVCLAGVICSISGCTDGFSSRLERVAVFAAVFFPLYVGLQLIPLPLPALRVFDPTRAEVADALGFVMRPPRLAS